tara:strand:- start:11855 stop:12415 length:561 start_codon:yes stop_codon:yes gene_type:complete
MGKKMRITKVYTRSGDKGKTMLVGGEIVSKDSNRVISYGDIDELNSALGVALAGEMSKGVKKIINEIQNDLFIIGADLAATKETKVPRIKKTRVNKLEKIIDLYNDKVGPLKEFILPTGSLVGSYLHLSRTICRRCERQIVGLGKTEWVNPNVMMYVNRLSDLLFVLARYENKISDEGEVYVNFKK